MLLFTRTSIPSSSSRDRVSSAIVPSPVDQIWTRSSLMPDMLPCRTQTRPAVFQCGSLLGASILASMAQRPVVLFVCVHNAGRSQMAAGLLRKYANGGVDVRSAGTAPSEEISPSVVAVMDEVGVDLSDAV